MVNPIAHGSLLGLLLVGCTAPPSAPERVAAPRVFTLAYPTMAEAIAGTDFRVVDVRPDHDDPEAWVPTSENTFTIQEDAPVLLVGAGFETWYRPENFSSVLTVRLADALGAGVVTRPSGKVDPFFWLEPESLALAGQAVADRLAQLRPDLEARLRERQKALATRLAQLEKSLRERSRDLPPLFAAREGYAYAARALGWKLQTLAVDPVAAPSPEARARWRERRQAHPASVLLFDRAPSQEVREALEADGLTPVVFPLLTRLPPEARGAGQSYFEVYAAAVERVRSAVSL